MLTCKHVLYVYVYKCTNVHVHVYSIHTCMHACTRTEYKFGIVHVSGCSCCVVWLMCDYDFVIFLGNTQSSFCKLGVWCYKTLALGRCHTLSTFFLSLSTCTSLLSLSLSLSLPPPFTSLSISPSLPPLPLSSLSLSLSLSLPPLPLSLFLPPSPLYLSPLPSLSLSPSPLYLSLYFLLVSNHIRS